MANTMFTMHFLTMTIPINKLMVTATSGQTHTVFNLCEWSFIKLFHTKGLILAHICASQYSSVNTYVIY